MNALHLSLFAAAITAVALGIYDKKTGLMPNLLTLGSLASALTIRSLAEGPPGAAAALLGVLIVAAPPAILFFATRGEAIGGGDVKALAALGAWLGPGLGLEVELLSFLLLAAFALLQQARKGRLLGFLRRSLWLFVPERLRSAQSTSTETMTYVRFGPFLALGTLVGCLSASVSASSALLALLS